MTLDPPDTNKPGFNVCTSTKTLVQNKRCPGCGKPIREEDFKDQASKDEYHISGLCQKCQDGIWA